MGVKTPTPKEKFEEIFYQQDTMLTQWEKFIISKEEYEKQTGVKLHFKNYDSYRKSVGRKK